MKKFFKNDIYLLITLLFVVLIFKNNVLFKNCILHGCQIFFQSVFPNLFEYNFMFYLNRWFEKIFYHLFHFSNAATYIFCMSLFSGTPTNAYIVANLVKNKHLHPKDAGIILSYSFFLNPLFLYAMLTTLLQDSKLVFRLIAIVYSVNVFLAFFKRNYPYQNIELSSLEMPQGISKVLSSSIPHAFQTLIQILGTMIFYFILCEGFHLFIKNSQVNCFINGFLEVTGGLVKLNTLEINLILKQFFAILFLSFGGLSIHSQIKNIILEENIPYTYFWKARCMHVALAVLLWGLTLLI